MMVINIEVIVEIKPPIRWWDLFRWNFVYWIGRSKQARKEIYDRVSISVAS